ncbi:hypothetical protein SAMN05421823_107258 [Catalinimonas alkaloidigena]|uniref:Uncharacterized protein n=2 Tax=Catalinimonas alkaloidigena TaxID=1075417 RepID=A0A1G9M4U7_9BACT|nr:hypothetical protein SAMN05421823_107258 [Catalinimonas alkaloidigena]
MMLVIALIIGVNTRGADQLPLLFIAKTLYVPFILSAITAFLGYATVLKEKKALRIMSMILGILFAMAGMYTGWQTIR